MSRRYFRRKIQENLLVQRRSTRRNPVATPVAPSPLLLAPIAASSAASQPPFRWNMGRREQLGTLLDGEKECAYPGFTESLVNATAEVVAFVGDCDLVFLGRSPESLFDLMQGLLQATTWHDRTRLLPFSMDLRRWARDLPTPERMAAYRGYLETRGLLPEQIALSPRPVAFVDIVASGNTFHNWVALLKRFADESGADWNAVRRKIRIVGMCRQEKTSPKTWRWQQHALWLPELLGTTRHVTNVALNPRLYQYLADYQPKTTPSYPPRFWDTPFPKQDSHMPTCLSALRLAHALYEEGTNKSCRIAFARILSKQRAMREPWLRQLVWS